MKFKVAASLVALLLSSLAEAAPSITSFTPAYGASSDLTPVYIYGSGFTGPNLVVRYGGPGGVQDPSAYAGFDYRIESRVPAGAALGPGKIYVSVNGQPAVSGTDFTVIGPGPYIDKFTPPGGTVGTTVTITGAHFTVGGNPTVKFNGLTAPWTTAMADSITVNAPAGVTTGPITVEGPGYPVSASAVPFYVNPSINSFSPFAGRAGTNVVIFGTNFTGATSVVFKNISVYPPNFTVNASNQITVTVPAGATTGPLYVYTPAPNPAFTTSNFVVQPLLNGFSPNKGQPGTSVTIFGENLWGATNVLFGNVKAEPVVGSVNYSQLSVVVPGGATNGYITVQTTNGSSVSSALFFLPPRITSLAPTNGLPGATIQIKGTNFLEATAVSFNGIPAQSFSVTNNDVIGAVVPPGVITGPVFVTTPYGTTNSGNLTFLGQPIIDGFTPEHGLPGTNVTVLGTNFTGVTAVKFNGTNAAFGVTNGILTARVPTNAISGPIAVTSPAGTTFSAGSFVLDYTADLGVTVTAPDSVLLTSNFTYVIVITNRGPFTAPNVTLTNVLPGSVTLQQASTSQGSLVVGNPVTGALGSLAPSNTVTVTLTVKPLLAEVVQDTAAVAGGLPDPVSTNNTGVASTTIYVVPVLALQLISGNQVQLSWSVSLSDYFLQSSTNVLTNWAGVLTVPQTVGDRKVVNEPLGAGARFYRLKR